MQAAKRFSRKKVLFLGVLASLALFLTYHFFFREAAPQYLTTPVVRKDLQRKIFTTGVIKPLMQVTVGSQVTGEIKALPVKVGERVTKGQLLAEIDPKYYQNKLAVEKASLNILQIKQRAKLADLKRSQVDYERQKKMFADGAGSQHDVDQAEAQCERHQADLDAGAIQIEKAKIDVKMAQDHLGYTKIVAPIDGQIIQIATTIGATVNASQSSPEILTIANLDTMEIRAPISEVDVPYAKPGTPIIFTTLSTQNKQFRSHLKIINPVPDGYKPHSKDDKAVYYSGIFEYVDTEHLLKPDMTAQVELLLANVNNALSIPVSALGPRVSSRHFLISVLDKNQKPQERQIETGLSDDIDIEVLDGLTEGEKIVLEDSKAKSPASKVAF